MWYSKRDLARVGRKWRHCVTCRLKALNLPCPVVVIRLKDVYMKGEGDGEDTRRNQAACAKAYGV